MSNPSLQPDNPVLRAELGRLYRDFFDRAEKKTTLVVAEGHTMGAR